MKGKGGTLYEVEYLFVDYLSPHPLSYVNQDGIPLPTLPNFTYLMDGIKNKFRQYSCSCSSFSLQYE